MPISIADAVRHLVHHKGISEELILKTVEEALLAAFKKHFGTTENAVTRIDEESGEVYIYARKEVVEEVENPLFEISIEEAKARNADVEVQDEVLIEVSPLEFGRIDAQSARQIILQRLKDIERNVIYNEYKDKIGELITGTYQRERFGTIFVDLGKVEAILPRGEQSPKEHFAIGDRIKAVIADVTKGPSIILSRANKDFVQRIFEMEVPEITEGIIEIKNIVRDPGSRTKIAVASSDIDPVGACVGMKGIRIQTIVKELEGEKIDIVRYSDDIREYIANALSPANVERVLVMSEQENDAIAIVDDDQLSLAIGKQGQNVKLACKLVGWNINVKTLEEYKEEGLEEESVAMAHQLFNEDDEVHSLDLLELSDSVIAKLQEGGINTIEDLIDKTKEELMNIKGIGMTTAENILKTLQDSVEVVTDEEKEEEVEVEEVEAEDVMATEETLDGDTVEEVVEYYCPECGHKLKEDQNVCPGCGVELEFE